MSAPWLLEDEDIDGSRAREVFRRLEFIARSGCRAVRVALLARDWVAAEELWRSLEPQGFFPTRNALDSFLKRAVEAGVLERAGWGVYAARLSEPEWRLLEWLAEHACRGW